MTSDLPVIWKLTLIVASQIKEHFNGWGVEISTTHVQRCVRLHRFLRVQIGNNFLWATSWVLKGALTGLSTAFDNNLRYFWRYLKINSSENPYFMRATARFVIPASAPIRWGPDRTHGLQIVPITYLTVSAQTQVNYAMKRRRITSSGRLWPPCKTRRATLDTAISSLSNDKHQSLTCSPWACHKAIYFK